MHIALTVVLIVGMVFMIVLGAGAAEEKETARGPQPERLPEAQDTAA